MSRITKVSLDERIQQAITRCEVAANTAEETARTLRLNAAALEVIKRDVAHLTADNRALRLKETTDIVVFGAGGKPCPYRAAAKIPAVKKKKGGRA